MLQLDNDKLVCLVAAGDEVIGELHVIKVIYKSKTIDNKKYHEIIRFLNSGQLLAFW